MSVAMAGSRTIRIEALYSEGVLRHKERLAALERELSASRVQPLVHLTSTERRDDLERFRESGGLLISALCVSSDRDAMFATDLLAKALPLNPYLYIDFEPDLSAPGVPCHDDSLVSSAASERSRGLRDRALRARG
jgi:hypothetical protein